MSVEHLLIKDPNKQRGPEHGIDPLPVEKGPMDPLYKVWSLVGAWPLSLGLMTSAFAMSVPLTLVMHLNRFQRLFPAPMMGMVLDATLSRVKVEFHPDFDKSRAAMYCMNHTSMLDAHVALRVIPQVFCGMMHAHHFDIPIYGWLMKRADGIGVAKGNGQFESVKGQLQDRISRGISVLAFPEGRRTQNGRVLPFRLGVFRMARDAGVPVVPLVTRGLWQLLRKGEWVARPTTVQVFVGPQIETEGLDDAQLEVLAERMQAFASDFAERGVLGDARALDPRV